MRSEIEKHVDKACSDGKSLLIKRLRSEIKDKDKNLESSLSSLKKICQDYINEDGRKKKK